jgi:hypothetical protein
MSKGPKSVEVDVTLGFVAFAAKRFNSSARASLAENTLLVKTW